MPKIKDVTDEVLRDSSSGPGKYVERVATAKPARDPQSAPTLMQALAKLEAQDDRSMGRISKPLAYSSAMPRGARDHASVIRLIKGGHVKVCEIAAPPPAGSNAKRDSPYGDRYYVLRIGSCGDGDAPDGALRGRRRK